jgi:DNA-binding GntR family transcriptional regulator
MEIADDIRNRVRGGTLQPGSRVGTFGSLGKDYLAAKGTIDKALDVLRQEGAVVTVAGKGIFVADRAIAGTTARSNPGDQRISEQIDALGEEIRRLARRINVAEAQAGVVSELRETVAGLQAQVMNLYHSTGQEYPYEESAAKKDRRAV